MAEAIALYLEASPARGPPGESEFVGVELVEVMA